MNRDEQLERLRRALWVATPALLAAVILYAYVGIGWYYFDRFSLDLGSQHFPAYRELHQLVIAIVFGIPSIALLGISMARLLATAPRLELAVERFFDAEDRTWIAFTSLAALLVPVAIRMLCLDDKIIVDDEHLYRFEAQLIAGGHLTMPSPPLKLFYDQGYLINDGRMYAMYFIGWPVLMAPGVWLGIPGYMNALYCALTVPPIFLLLRALTSARWAKLGAVLYVASPILMIGAATQMSHTSGIFALAWMAWFVLKTTPGAAADASDHDRARWPWHAGVAAFFSLAFFIRPTVALGIGLPLLVAWALGMRDLWRDKALRTKATHSLLAFGAIALVAAIAFLSVDKAQTGAFFTTAYARDKTYAVENGLRFSMWGVPGLVEYLATDPVPHFQTDRPFLACMAEWGIAMLRMNYNTFGWPFSLAFVFFARGRWAKILGWMFFTFSAIHFYVLAPGVDSYGPHHYIELALPILLLTILGAHRITEAIGRAPQTSETTLPRVSWGRVPVTIVFAAIAFGLLTYMPPRALALVSMAENAHEPEYLAEKQGIHRAVVFSARPFASKFIGCAQTSAQHNVYWHPLNAPSLDGDIVWVNHISVKDDKRLMKYYPDRRGFIMVWLPGCELRYLPIEKMQPGDVTDGYIGGSEKGLDDSER